MTSKRHTVILVPHAHAKFRKFQVTTLQIATVATAFLVVTVAAVFIAWSYLSPAVDAEELARLRVENGALREVNGSFEDNIRQLREELATYEERTRKLAIVAGLDELGVGGESGLGGDSEGPSGVEPRLSALSLWAGQLGGRMTRVEEALEDRHRWISSVPSISPSRGLKSSGFGYRLDPFDGRRAFHRGLDITAAPDRPVHATADGIVTRSGRAGRLGNAVYLSHGFGLTTRYGHLSRTAVRAGQRVKRGDVLGYVGSTGRATGYHLHYEVRKDGQPVDPMMYILDAPGANPS